VFALCALSLVAGVLANGGAARAATSYPVGTPSASEPSGMAPPGADALSGFTQEYTQDFTGTALPGGWGVYSGQPGGDTGALFGGTRHVVVGAGVLSLKTFLDPALGGAWATGGTCYCTGQTYGAWFIRSRVTGAGPTQVELLWPDAKVWPPEVDFNESGGGTTSTSATVHWGSTNSQDQRKLSSIDLTQWHTWGVVWTPSALIYTLDGRVWGSVTNASEIPNQPMHLSLQQQTWCASGWACPTSPIDMQVDWVSSYAWDGTTTTTTVVGSLSAPGPVMISKVSFNLSKAVVSWSSTGSKALSSAKLTLYKGMSCTRAVHSKAVSYSPSANVVNGSVTLSGTNWFSPVGSYMTQIVVTNAAGSRTSDCVSMGKS
jgi:hypothetical protein